jgi:hypothetical protein
MASLTFGTVPADQLPYYLWWYNRCEGMKSPAPALLKFDSHRGCLPYAMLCSPVGVEEKDPTGVLPPSYYSQTRGLAFFRNRWKDADDILATISADAHNAGIGWDSCGTLGLNLLAFNTRFFGQPEKVATCNPTARCWSMGAIAWAARPPRWASPTATNRRRMAGMRLSTAARSIRASAASP